MDKWKKGDEWLEDGEEVVVARFRKVVQMSGTV